MGALTPQPALLGRSNNLLTFFVGGEQVAPLTEDQTWDVIAGTALVSGELPFYVVTRAQQRVQARETINAPGGSTDAMGARAIGGLAGLGLLAMAALVAVCLKHAGKRHVSRLARLDLKAKLEEDHREYRHTYAEHLGISSSARSARAFVAFKGSAARMVVVARSVPAGATAEAMAGRAFSGGGSAGTGFGCCCARRCWTATRSMRAMAVFLGVGGWGYRR
jgi:hypothetical protein